MFIKNFHENTNDSLANFWEMFQGHTVVSQNCRQRVSFKRVILKMFYWYSDSCFVYTKEGDTWFWTTPILIFFKLIMYHKKDHHLLSKNDISITNDSFHWTFGLKLWAFDRGGPHLWPARIPYLIPLDFSLRGYLKLLVYSTPVEKDSRNRLVDVFERVRQSMRKRCILAW